MEILKVGTKNKIKATCHKCGTIFLLGKDEIQTSLNVSIGKRPVKSGKFIGCPSCHAILEVKGRIVCAPSEDLKEELFRIRFDDMRGW